MVKIQVMGPLLMTIRTQSATVFCNILKNKQKTPQGTAVHQQTCIWHHYFAVSNEPAVGWKSLGAGTFEYSVVTKFKPGI